MLFIEQLLCLRHLVGGIQWRMKVYAILGFSLGLEMGLNTRRNQEVLDDRVRLSYLEWCGSLLQGGDSESV